MDMLDLDKKKAPSLQQYDDIFYVDSDAAFVPKLQNRTVSDFYDYWSDKHVIPDCKTGDDKSIFKDKKGNDQCGIHINNASMVFFSNALAATYPCTGLILLKTDQMAINKELLLDWWNQRDEVDNFDNAYEQSTFVKMVLKRHRILQHFAYMHGETEFVPCEDQWICHLSHYFAVKKIPLLQSWVTGELGINDDSKYQKELKEILEGHMIDIPSLALTEYIENYMNLDSAGVKGPASKNKMYGRWREFRGAQSNEDNEERRYNGTSLVHNDGENVPFENTTITNSSAVNNITAAVVIAVGNNTNNGTKKWYNASSAFDTTIVSQGNSSDSSHPIHMNVTKNETVLNTTSINATSINATSINATSMNATSINATNINATSINVTSINTTNINATSINATNLNATSIKASNISATSTNAPSGGRSNNKNKSTTAPTAAPSSETPSKSFKIPSAHPIAYPTAHPSTIQPSVKPTKHSTPTMRPTMNKYSSPSSNGVTLQPSSVVTIAPSKQEQNDSTDLIKEGEEEFERDITRYSNASTTWIENNLYVPGQTARNKTVLYSIYTLFIVAIAYVVGRLCCRCCCWWCGGVETVSVIKKKKQTYLPVNTMEDLLYDDDVPDRSSHSGQAMFEEEEEEEFMAVGFKRQQGIEMSGVVR